jgi:hypothetical protein
VALSVVALFANPCSCVTQRAGRRGVQTATVLQTFLRSCNCARDACFQTCQPRIAYGHNGIGPSAGSHGDLLLTNESSVWPSSLPPTLTSRSLASHQHPATRPDAHARSSRLVSSLHPRVCVKSGYGMRCWLVCPLAVGLQASRATRLCNVVMRLPRTHASLPNGIRYSHRSDRGIPAVPTFARPLASVPLPSSFYVRMKEHKHSPGAAFRSPQTSSARAE